MFAQRYRGDRRRSRVLLVLRVADGRFFPRVLLEGPRNLDDDGSSGYLSGSVAEWERSRSCLTGGGEGG